MSGTALEAYRKRIETQVIDPLGYAQLNKDNSGILDQMNSTTVLQPSRGMHTRNSGIGRFAALGKAAKNRPVTANQRGRFALSKIRQIGTSLENLDSSN